MVKYNTVLTRGELFSMPKMPDIQPVDFYQVIDNAASSSLGSVLSRLVRLNSLYDPDLSGIGSQPLGFD